MKKPTERFSSRVENYIKYRPHYPQGITCILEDECGLTPEWKIADIGSGTGFSCEPFLMNGNSTFGVEPNGPMREAAESLLAQYPHFISVLGSAENTTLADSSVDMVVAGQAFHWFDQQLAKAEFRRILLPGGWIVLFWNYRKHESPFQDDWEQLLRKYSSEYEKVKHENIDEPEIHSFFEPSEYKVQTCPNFQVLDLDAFKGRVLSCSYTPEPGQPEYEPMLSELRRIFDKYQEDGRVIAEYDLRLYSGQVK